MTHEEMIAVSEFCVSHNVEISFVDELCDAGLLELKRINDNTFIAYDQLPDLERLARWHYEMDINLGGIEAIHHLLEHISEMQREMREVKSRLNLYENTGDRQMGNHRWS